MTADDTITRRVRSIEDRLSALSLRATATPLNVEDVERFEADAGVELPDEFRAFVIEVGVGGSGPGAGIHGLDAWAEAILDPFPGMFSAASPLSPERHAAIGAAFEDAAQGAIAIASEGAGAPFTLLVVSGEQRGALLRYQVESGWCDRVERVAPLGPVSFLDWYEAWLDVVESGGRPTFFGAGLLGSVRELARCAGDDAVLAPLRVRALATLAHFGALDEATLRRVEHACDAADATVRARAISVYARARGEDALPRLERALRDAAPEVRLAAVVELSLLKSSAALDALTLATDDPDDTVADRALIAIEGTAALDFERLARLYARPALRQRVVSDLRAFRTTDALAILARALHDPDPHVRRIAAFSIAQARLVDGIDALQSAVAGERDPAVASAMQRALAQLTSTS